MKKAEIVKSMNGFLSKTSFQLKKHSPEILVVAGVIGVVTSAVMACKATTKVGEILDKTKEDVETIHKCEADESVKERYSSEDAQKDLAIVYVQTGMKFAKLYGPSVILGALSITSILASNNILRKRNVALSAAYAAIDKGFKEYRSRVIERFGEEVDRELKYNLKAKKFDETVIDEETGKEKKVIPGETGTFDIVINGDSADVDFDYTITFEKGTDLNNIAVKFYDVTDNNNNDITEAGLTQTIGMDDGNKTVTKKIKWELPSGENDAENLAGKDISYKIVMNATQKGVCESFSVNKVLKGLQW